MSEKAISARGDLKLSNITKTYGDFTAVNDLSLVIPEGSFFALPASGEGLVSKWNAQKEVVTEPYYLDLQSGSWLSAAGVL